VVQILRQVTDDQHVLAAAWLHDMVEDTEATQHRIEELSTRLEDVIKSIISDKDEAQDE
jgi:(p)ppGpp synthase/HD superfamily hydrolase